MAYTYQLINICPMGSQNHKFSNIFRATIPPTSQALDTVRSVHIGYSPGNMGIVVLAYLYSSSKSLFSSVRNLSGAAAASVPSLEVLRQPPAGLHSRADFILEYEQYF